MRCYETDPFYTLHSASPPEKFRERNVPAIVSVRVYILAYKHYLLYAILRQPVYLLQDSGAFSARPPSPQPVSLLLRHTASHADYQSRFGAFAPLDPAQPAANVLLCLAPDTAG